MKIKLLISALMFTMLLLTSCGNNKTILWEVSGETDLINDTYIYVVNSKESFGPENFRNAIDSLYVNSLGRFSGKFNFTYPGFYQLRYKKGAKKFNLYNNIDFYIDRSNTIEIVQSERNYTVNEKIAVNDVQFQLLKIINEFQKSNTIKYKYSVKEFIKWQNLLKIELNKQMDIFVKNNKNISEKYLSYLNSKKRVKLDNDKLGYLQYFNYYSNGEMEYLNKDQYPNTWNFDLNDISSPIFFDEAMNYFSNVITFHFQNSTKMLTEDDKWVQEFKWKIDYIRNNTNSVFESMALYSLSSNFWIYLSISSEDFYRNLESLNTYFEQKIDEDVFKIAFNKVYLDFKKIAPNELAPNFTLKDNKGNMVSLSDFFGKIVYIDFWGTWCSPCIKAIPHHLKLQEEFNDNPEVKLLYIAMESKDDEKSFKRWNNFLKNKNFTGTHLIAKNQFNNEELKAYKISAAPTYVLIDKNGRIVKSRALGPDKIRDNIIALIKKK